MAPTKDGERRCARRNAGGVLRAPAVVIAVGVLAFSAPFADFALPRFLLNPDVAALTAFGILIIGTVSIVQAFLLGVAVRLIAPSCLADDRYTSRVEREHPRRGWPANASAPAARERRQWRLLRDERSRQAHCARNACPPRAPGCSTTVRIPEPLERRFRRT